jgi:hypothetical protein
MDWARTKTLFIIAFALVNLFFASQIWLIPAYLSAPRSLNPQQVEIRLQELRFRGIKVTAPVPRTMQPQRMMEFQAIALRYNLTADKLLGPGWQKVEEEGFQRGEAILQISNDGSLIYTNPVGPGGFNQTKAEAQSTAESFLEETLGLPQDARLIMSRNLGGTIYLEYRQIWRRQQLAVSYIRLWIAQEQVARMEWYWAEPAGRLATDLAIIPSTGALLIAADYLLPPAVVNNVFLSWYSEPLSAARWRVPCVWVIETVDTRLYINAFTGELEAREEIPAGELPANVE